MRSKVSVRQVRQILDPRHVLDLLHRRVLQRESPRPTQKYLAVGCREEVMRPRYQRQLAGQDVDDDLIVRRAGYPFVAGVRREASQAAGAAPTLRYGPAGDSAPRLRLKASGMAES